MTNSEQKSIDQLSKILVDIQTANNKFREDVTGTVNFLAVKIEKKHLPITLEQNILAITQNSISDAIKTALTNYNSPLVSLVKSVVDENGKELKQLISDSFQSVIRTDDFKQSIVSAFSHKVAKTIISNNDGLFDKVSNELKQDSVFKSKMTIAVSNVVEECLKNK